MHGSHLTAPFQEARYLLSRCRLSQSVVGFYYYLRIENPDPEFARELLRPPDVKEDVKLMEQRRRVSLVLGSKLFRKDLEKIVASQMKSGCLNTNLVALQQIIDYLTPHTKLGSSTFTKSATMPIVPINDLQGMPSQNYRKGERLLRCKLASVYRLVDICGWNRGMSNHVTVRVTKDADEFLINPLGLLYHELTASSLVKIDLEGNMMDPSNGSLGIDKAGWQLHSAVHASRRDVRCILHLSTPATIAVSSCKAGLLPISQEAMILGKAVTYDPLAVSNAVLSSTSDEPPTFRKAQLAAAQRSAISELLSSVPTDCMVMLIKNNGIFAMGKSIDEAWYNAFLLTIACESQLRLAGISSDELVLPTQNAQDVAHQAGQSAAHVQLHGGVSWRRGELEFEALMRRLDAAGYMTGHVYHIRNIRQSGMTGTYRQTTAADATDGIDSREAAASVRKYGSMARGGPGTKDVEIPPVASSFATTFNDDRDAQAAAASARAKTATLGWLTSPNAYQREDIEEIGIGNPKRIPRWKANTLSGGTIQLTNPDQFVRSGGNPLEFKRHQMKVRERYYKDVKTAGPQSRILDGLDADDETDLTDAGDSALKSPRGTLLRLDPAKVEPGHVVMVGAASKGIIDPKQRHKVALYQSVYSPNPFDRVTDDELRRYRENVDRKAKGLPSLEEEECEADERRHRELARQAAESARQVMESGEQYVAEHEKAGKLKSMLQPSGSRTDTSGAEASHDDTDKESKKDGETVPERRKKYRFKMPSFARKQKPKPSK